MHKCMPKTYSFSFSFKWPIFSGNQTIFIKSSYHTYRDSWSKFQQVRSPYCHRTNSAKAQVHLKVNLSKLNSSQTHMLMHYKWRCQYNQQYTSKEDAADLAAMLASSSLPQSMDPVMLQRRVLTTKHTHTQQSDSHLPCRHGTASCPLNPERL